MAKLDSTVVYGDLTVNGTIVGTGTALTNLNANSLTSGTISDLRLPYATSSNKGAIRINIDASGTVNIYTS